MQRGGGGGLVYRHRGTSGTQSSTNGGAALRGEMRRSAQRVRPTSSLLGSESFAKRLPRCSGESAFRARRPRGPLNKRPVADTHGPFVSSLKG